MRVRRKIVLLEDMIFHEAAAAPSEWSLNADLHLTNRLNFFNKNVLLVTTP